MIEFLNSNHVKPFVIFKDKYDNAIELGQKNAEAVSISSFSKSSNEVNARFVNLKILDNEDFIFFSNYNSQKSIDFKEHDQITALFFWSSINTQIRIKALLKKTPSEFNNKYFIKRSNQKNALAISSDQSKLIDSFDTVHKKYNEVLKSGNLSNCPDYWGGYLFNPYYFEFWEGHESRLNKRDVYEFKNGNWVNYLLQP